MNGELIKRIVKCCVRRDDEGFFKAVRQLVQSERRQGHVRLAEEIQQMLGNWPTPDQGSVDFRKLTTSSPLSRGESAPLVEVRRARRTLEDIVLAPQPRRKVLRFLEEYSKQSTLAEYGLSPKRKLLFYGPPGNGKTLCAEVISSELGLPLYYVRFDALVASFLGETAANLRRVFEFGASTLGVLFFDEFDAIGKTRDDRSDVGELKRVVNSFLQLLDNYQGKGPVLAATNYERLLDYALWRRFDDLVFFPRATKEQLIQYLDVRLRGVRLDSLSSTKAAEWCVGCSFSDVDRITTEAIKTMVLGGDVALSAKVFQAAVAHYGGTDSQETHHPDWRREAERGTHPVESSIGGGEESTEGRF